LTSVVVDLPYGEGKVSARIPRESLISVVSPRRLQAVKDPPREIGRALDHPVQSAGLEGLVEKGDRVCVIVNDATRPTPTWLILPVLLKRLNHVGISDEAVQVLVATGLHSAPTAQELDRMLGADVLRRVPVINHDAYKEEDLRFYGHTSRKTPVWVNKRVSECDFLLSVGYIEPHFFAGYTGGAKNIIPGISGLETVKVNHGAAMIGHLTTRAGMLKGNPVYEDIVEGSSKVGLDFILDVVLNHEKKLVKAVAGDMREAHLEGVRFMDRHVRVEAAAADVVVTTNFGYPLDRNLYQAVKGMAAAETLVKPGGFIIIASECRDGVGHPNFQTLLTESKTPEALSQRIMEPGFFMVDQWEAQVMARILTKARVIVVTGGIKPETLIRMHVTPAQSVEEALEIVGGELGRKPEVCVIPEGPSTIPQLPKAT